MTYIRALEFLDVLGGMFGYLRLKSGITNILSEDSEPENLQRQSGHVIQYYASGVRSQVIYNFTRRTDGDTASTNRLCPL